MRSPAAAIGWEFSRRHRWGFIAVAVYLLSLIALTITLGSGQFIRLDPPDGRAGYMIAPFSMSFFYFIAVFSFGLSGDLAARESMFPARMFTLPITTAALAGWPMLYGAAAMLALWLVAALCARWLGLELPLIWPALLALTFLAWTQALTWMPYGLRGLRVIAAVLWLMMLDVVVISAIHFQASELFMIAMLAPQLPLAYLAARFAVARARNGEVADWRVPFTRLAARVDRLPRRRAAFPSAARAQLWFEWRRHGLTLPVWIAILTPLALALVFQASHPRSGRVFYTVLLVLFLPYLMASFSAAPTITPFLTTRPLTSAELVAARLKAMLWSTTAAWLLVLVAIPLALTLSGTWPAITERVHALADFTGPPRAVVLLLLVLWLLIAATWKQLMQGMYIGLSGRAWLSKAHLALALTFLVMIGPFVQWIHDDSGVRISLWEALPQILAVLVLVKLSAAVWVALRLFRTRAVKDRTLVVGAAVWCICVLTVYGILAWFFATPFVPRYVLALIAILMIPLTRLSAAPLALAWNRHRS